MKKIYRSGLTFAILVYVFVFSYSPASKGASAEPQPGSLAAAFEKNLGQAPARYRFLSRRSSVNVFFLDNGVDLLLPSKAANRHRIGFNFSGSRPDVVPEGRSPLPAVSNYLLGNDPSRWIRGVPNQSQVLYRQIYPGIDLVFHGQGNEMEHDFQVAPGADPSAIGFALEGADEVALDGYGNLMISFGTDTLFLQKPQAYQETVNGRQPVESHFVLNHDRSVQFQVGSYDRKLELIIDPIFIFSTYLASNSGDWPTAITSDSAGNVYVTGYTDGLDFPLENGIQTSVTGSPNVFVSKLDPTGHKLLYSTYLGGSSRNYGNAIEVDASGNIIVAGTSASNDFPHAGSVPSLTCQGNNDCYFLVSLKSDGSAFNYARLIGGIEGTDAQSGGGPGAGNIAVDAAGNTFLTGITDDANFEITPGTLATGVQGGGYPYNSTFIMKVSPVGALIYSTIVPGTAQQNVTVNLNNVFVAAGISVDSKGQATIAGTAGPGLPSTAGVIQATFPNSLNVENASAGFLLKLNATASAITYATYVPGTDSIGGYAVDSQGNSYVTGGTSETNLPVSSTAYQKKLRAGQTCTCNSGFILKLNSSGTSVLAGTYLEGTPLAPYNLGTRLMGLALDSNSNVFVGGITGSTDFPLANPFTSVLVSNASMVLAGMSSDFSSLLFGSFLSSTDQIFPASNFAGISVDRQDHLLVLGQTSTTDFPTTAGSFQPTPPSQAYHAFVVSFDMATPAPSVCLDSWSANFGSVIAKQSNTQVVHLTNCGNAPLSIPSFASSSGTVTVQQTCSSSIQPGAVCPLSLVYTPLDSSALAGTLTLTDDAQIPTQVIQLSGQGVAPQLSPSTSSFSFGDLLVNTVGAGLQLGFANTGNSALVISSASVNGDFSISQNICTGTLQPHGFCFITVVFSPTTAGLRTGTLTIISNDPVYPQAGLSLVGIGDTAYAAPLVSALTTPTAQIGSGPITLQVYGANFYPASVVLVDGTAQQTIYMNQQQLQTTLSSAATSAVGEVAISVSNPAPGGGTSVSVPLTLYQVASLDATFLTSVPGSPLIYASIPSSASTNPNTVIAINPTTGALGTPIPVGNNPGLLAPSSDGSYLFVVANQDLTVQRINLSTKQVEKTFAFPPNGTTCCGALAATDLKGLPGSPKEVVLATNIPGYGFGEIALYNDTGMVNYVPPSSIVFPPAFGSFAYAGSPLTIYALPFTLVQNFFSIVTIGSGGLGYTPLTGGNYGGNNTTGSTVASDGTLLYTSAGQVWNPTTQKQAGSFPVTTYNDTSYPNLYNLVVDTSSGHIFVIGAENYLADSSSVVLSAYSQSSLALTGSLALPQVSLTSSQSLVRWGSIGFAFVAADPSGTSQAVYLLTSSLAGSATSNPVPQIGSISPSSTPQGSSDLQLTLNGQGFVPDSVVQWNGTPLQATYVSRTVLTAVLPANNLGSSGTVSLTVSNPAPGGGRSNPASFTISPLAPLLALSSSVLTFSSQQVGTSSIAQTVAVQNPGTATLAISDVTMSGTDAASFQQTSTCGTSLAAGANCTVSVIFAPTATGTQNATVTFTDNAADGPQTLSLSGTGGSIGLGSGSGGSTSATVTAGATATYNLVIGGAGVSGAATITCTGAPTGANCSVPSSVTLNATSPSALTAKITTTARTSAVVLPSRSLRFWAILVFGLAILQFPRTKRSRPRWANTLPLLLLVFLCSCGGGGTGTQSNPIGTPAGQYKLTVTATTASNSQSLQLNLTVQ
jgi:Abnormal spindle-like microcephaly-assoc'd, ASPM-SPD-2-Hydin/Beta-propeller repeat